MPVLDEDGFKALLEDGPVAEAFLRHFAAFLPRRRG